jgi:hypothetical protein
MADRTIFLTFSLLILAGGLTFVLRLAMRTFALYKSNELKRD